MNFIKYYKFVNFIKKYNISSIKQLKQHLYNINLYLLSYKKEYIKLNLKFIKIYKNLINIYNKYSKLHKIIYPNKHFNFSNNKATDFINKIKYKIFIKNLLNLIKNNINIEI
jgi:hypothetical protein